MAEQKIKSVAIAAVKKSGQILLKRYNNFDRASVRLKSAHEIVTGADLESERIIMTTIQKVFPDHRILSEEAGSNAEQSEYLWLIDPLDGTTNFSMHNPLWSISLALTYQGEIIVGVVYAPCL
ncbi:MAG: inositol monophosphatase, partial [Candidatus Falkowbacteria bacterium]|nr:inositol monophosphatase [Candidatus Falkowbacteria bacterium]